jgi:hypothetical protein
MSTFSTPLIARLRELALGAAPGDPAAWARHHKVDTLLDRLDPEGPWGTPEERRQRHATALVRWTIVLDHLVAALDAFRADDVSCLVLKGAALALVHYPSPVYRAMQDVDVLVSPSSYARANAALVRAGFTAETVADYATAYRTPDGRGRIELHRALTSCERLFALPFEALWERRQSLAPAVDGATLGDADLLVHLAIHAAFQHGFTLRLAQYLDFERLAAREAGADDARVARARDAGALPAVAASALVAERLFGVAPVPALAVHVPAAIRSWVNGGAARPWALCDGMPLARARWHLIPGWRRKASLLRATLAPDDRLSPWALARRLHALRVHCRAE